ncbi:TetR/AcrR family transcriptional regulator [Brachybacterium aquaticum]|uniref:AcrR family transcriptional regulator n=1 Tax=Brachybacterium aquaticum TaxID=1432564 RepID=A0A841AAL9_9MICO|nr:TetR/AcrR family transcriptional regulator [Brachybacterium aquaticum]MBB5831896.1 AcrR family transcriptional regulator [Brachybacterium aquaticum]
MTAPATGRMPREQRRSQLLRLATRVFTEKGYQATSMDDIATAAGVTKPVLYQHFRSKETLYVEVLDVIGESMLTEVRAITFQAGDTTGRVRDALHRFYEFVALENSLRLFTGHEVISDAVQERVEQVLDALSIELAGVLTSYRRLSTVQARTLGRGLIAVAQTTAQILHDAEGDEMREEILSAMTTTVVHGLSGFDLIPAEGSPAAQPPGEDAEERSAAEPSDAEAAEPSDAR